LEKKEFGLWFSKYYRLLRSSREKGLILDVGCGVGQVATKLAEDGFGSVGIDVSPSAIRLSVKGSEKSEYVSFIVASCYNLPFKEQTFQVVGCLYLLEHLSDPEACLDEMLRVVKEKGNIVVVSPNFLHALFLRRPKLEMVLNIKRLLRARARIKTHKKVCFEHIEPKLDWSGRKVGCDLDAITLTDPITIKELLKKKGVEIVYHSWYHGDVGLKGEVIDKLATMPLFRNLGGGIFIVGKLMKTSKL